MMQTASDAPTSRPADSALAVIGTHCPHCPAVLAALTELVKSGELARLDIINLEKQPEAAARLGVRAVPWVMIGQIELYGLRSKQEYSQWIARAAHEDAGMRDYMQELLGSGEIERVEQRIAEDRSLLQWVVELLGDADAKINLRLGIGVIMEQYADSEDFAPYLDDLVAYTAHQDARVRADACHYLALTRNPQVIPVLERLLEDDSAEVREVAADGLAELGDAAP